MKRMSDHRLWLSLLLLPVAALAAPPPYWPYPPSPYYYPPPAAMQSIEEQVNSSRAPTATGEENGPAAPANETKTTVDVEVEIAPHPEEEGGVIESREETTVPDTSAKTEAEAEIAPTLVQQAEAEQTLKEALSREIARDIQQGNFAEAYYLWRPRAEAGDAEAQYGIGWMYHNGYGLAINDKEAITWWEMAARQGHIDATFALGMLYGLGEGEVRRDTQRAIYYYHQAAARGHEDARLLLLTLIQQKNRDAHQLMLTLIEEGRVDEISDTPATTVISSKANVRKGASTKHKVLTTLEEGHTLFPIKRQGRWLLVGVADKPFIGWIHDSLVGEDILTTD